MARVLGPNNIPITPATGGAPTRAGGESFGAQMANAQHDAGRALTSIGVASGKLADQRQALEDADFETRASVAFDEDFQAASLDEDGRLGSTERLRGTFKKRPDDVIQSLREQGFNPSKEAEQRAKLTGLTKASTYLRRNAAQEHNTRVQGAFDSATTTVGIIGQRAAKTGDLTGGFAEVESVLSTFERALPPAAMAKLRENAAETLLGAFADHPEELETMLDAVVNPRRFDDVNPETRGVSRRRENSTASDFDIPEAQRSRLPAGMRNNNPGNIKFTTGSSKRPGVVGPSQNLDGGDPQLVFDTPQAGMDAMADLAQRKYRAGQTTAMALIAGRNGWTPGNQSAAANVARTLGRRPDDDLQLDDPEQLSAFLKALALQEHGPASKLYPDELYDAAAQAGGGARRDQLPDGFKGDLARVLLGNAGKIRAAVADRRRAAGLIAGNELADPSSKDDRDSIDKAVSSVKLGQRLKAGEPLAAAETALVVRNTGHVPEPAVSALRAMTTNGNAEQKAFGYETAANLMRVKPGSLEGSDKARALRDDALTYEALTVDAGLSVPQATARIAEMNTPDFKAKAKAMEKEAHAVIKEVSADDLAGDFDGWFSRAPELGGTPAQGALVLDAYRDLVRYHFTRTADGDLAKSLAKHEMLKTYGVSEVTGNRRLMRNPPENHYPAIARTEDETPGHQYITDELVKLVNDQVPAGGIAAEDIFLEPVPQTNSDIRAGHPPRYGVVWFEERDGIRVMQSAPGMVFRPDYQAAQRQQSGWRQRVMGEMRAKGAYQQDVVRRLGLGDIEMGTADFSGIQAPYTAADVERAYMSAWESWREDQEPEYSTMEGFVEQAPVVPPTRNIKKFLGEAQRIPVGPAPDREEMRRRMQSVDPEAQDRERIEVGARRDVLRQRRQRDLTIKPSY